MKKELVGEFIGTFILVFIGCGGVAAAVVVGALESLMSVAVVFGMAVTIAIFCTRSICPAHINPAVSFAMCLNGSLPWKKLLPYSLSQILGAFFAAVVLYWFNQDTIATYEATNSIIRGSSDSIKSAMIFGEFFPNPGFADTISVTWIKAMCIEILCTTILVLAVFKVTEVEKEIDNVTAVIIGVVVMLLIIMAAPYTQACFNPARDFGPRMLSFFAGWGSIVFDLPGIGWLTVYILGPFTGGALGYLIHRATLKSA